jgi:hypothetical protein
MNNLKPKIMTVFIPFVLMGILMGMNSGCRDKSSAEESPAQIPKRAVVSDEGTRIIFPENSPGLEQIKTSPIHKGSATLAVVAPARIVASIISAGANGGTMALFESPDVTSLYSSYRQSKSNAERANKELERTKDMFENQAATGKDLTEAENDAATANASMAEMDGRLRALGFNSSELDAELPNRIWLISDVPEAGLNDIRKGESVSITFNSLPDKKFEGRADAIGDIVDPATRTVKVRITMSNPENRLMPGMFARVEFGEPKNAVIILPLNAVVTVDAKDYVFVNIAPGEFARREVTLTNVNSVEAIALNGIKEGENVVTSGAMLLKGLSFGY